MPRAVTYAVFIVLVLGGGLLIGSVSMPDGWYAALSKPSFNPPNWIFAPVWSVLYIMIAIAGARTYERGGTGMWLWAAQLALNFAWSPAFFLLHRPALALGIIIALLLVIIGFIVERWRRDQASALLFLPYAAWVAFATLLNAAIVRLN
jgi:tryptophan-rich sensory protein